MKKSEAKKIRMLLKKKKGILKKYYDTIPFTEPAMLLMRRGNKSEFYEKATQGEFNFTHTDGTERFITLNPKWLQTIPYGPKTFRMYICHEDHPTPLPNDPIITAEMMNIGINKTLHDIKKWKAEEIKAKGDFIWKVLIGIAIIIAAYGVYKIMLPAAPAPTQQIVNTVVSNATTIVRNATIL